MKQMKTVQHFINETEVTEDQARQIIMNTPKGQYVEVVKYVEVECHDGIVRGRWSERTYEGQKQI